MHGILIARAILLAPSFVHEFRRPGFGCAEVPDEAPVDFDCGSTGTAEPAAAALAVQLLLRRPPGLCSALAWVSARCRSSASAGGTAQSSCFDALSGSDGRTACPGSGKSHRNRQTCSHDRESLRRGRHPARWRTIVGPTRRNDFSASHTHRLAGGSGILASGDGHTSGWESGESIMEQISA